jgi:hypothetical protein
VPRYDVKPASASPAGEANGGFRVTWLQSAATDDEPAEIPEAPDPSGGPVDCITTIAMFFPEFFRSRDA